MEPSPKRPVSPTSEERPVAEHKGPKIEPNKMDEVFPFLYLGSSAAAGPANWGDLQTRRVTRVLCCAESCMPCSLEKLARPFVLRRLSRAELEEAIRDVSKIAPWIEEPWATNEATLIHCQLGQDRSAALVIAYLMNKKGRLYHEIFAKVRKVRSCISPSHHYEQLLGYQPN